MESDAYRRLQAQRARQEKKRGVIEKPRSFKDLPLWQKALIGTAVIVGGGLRLKEFIDIVTPPPDRTVPPLSFDDPALNQVEENMQERAEQDRLLIEGFSDDPATPGFTRAEVAFLVDQEPGGLQDSCLRRVRFSGTRIMINSDYGIAAPESGHLSCKDQEIVLTPDAFRDYSREQAEEAAFTLVHESAHSLFYGLRISTNRQTALRARLESYVRTSERIRFSETEGVHNTDPTTETQIRGREYPAELYSTIIRIPPPPHTQEWHLYITRQLRELYHLSAEEAERNVCFFEEVVALKYGQTSPAEIHARTYRAIQIILTHRLRRLSPTSL